MLTVWVIVQSTISMHALRVMEMVINVLNARQDLESRHMYKQLLQGPDVSHVNLNSALFVFHAQ